MTGNVQYQYSYSYGEIEKTPTRSSIIELESALKDRPDAIGDVEMEKQYVRHFFADGMYGREMTIPKGLCVVGKIHKHAHINVITEGVIKVVTEFGEDVYTAPRTWVSEPGTKRAVYALEKTVWLTTHANPSNTQDIREIEQDVISPDFESFDRLQLESGSTV